MSETTVPLDEPARATTGTQRRGAVRGADTVELGRRVDALAQALDLAGDRAEPDVVAAVNRTLERVRARLDLGVDQTVVALAGGTGSGKSSLFNAIAGLEVAEVGVKRPTSALVTACVWGPDGGPLLDWLGVGPDDRIERESLLDGDREAPLRGLVLLDLPDHDSISPAHRVIVDRVIPLTDLIVWVVDPQKYADDALHTGYLQRLVGHEASMLVVLNQADTLADGVLPELVRDLGRLLIEDGLDDQRVLTASARTGEGVEPLRAALAEMVERRSLAARRAADEVVDAAGLVAASVGATEPSPSQLALAPVVDALSAAVGLSAVADAVGAVVRSGTSQGTAFGPAPRDAVDLARTGWLERATSGLPRVWADDVAGRVATTEELRLSLSDALAAVTLSARRSRIAAALVVLAVVLAVAGLACASVALGERLGPGQLPGWPMPAALGCLLAAVVAWWIAVRVRQVAARRRTATVAADGRAAIDAMARERLVRPTQEVLDELRQVRAFAAQAAAARR